MTRTHPSFDDVTALREAVASIRRFGDRFVLDIGAPDAWSSSADLLRSDGHGLAELIAGHAEHRRIADLSDAASLFTQRYAHRLCAVTLGPWLVSGVSPRVDPSLVSVNVVDSSPAGLAVRELRPLVGDIGSVIDHVVDDHLSPFVDAVRRTSRIGLPNLWGNITAAIAGVFGPMSDTALANEWPRSVAGAPEDRPASAIADTVDAIANEALQRRPELADRGEFVRLERDGRSRLFFERSTCCRWYRIPDGSLCSWCNRHEPGRRREIFLDALTRPA